MTTATGHQLDTPGATPVFWQDLSSRWSTFPRRTRLNHLKSAAGRVRSLWQGSMDITALPLDLLLYQPESGSAAFPEHLLTRLPKPLSVARLLEKLADWHADARLTLAPGEGRFFLRHLLGGAGALETIFAVLAVRERIAPPTINLNEPDPALPVDVAIMPRELPAGQIAALNNSFGFGGHNVSLLIASV